jgi:VWFA-related protein
VETRKVVLVFTDGEDTASRVKAGDAIERARAEDVMVYSIGLENEYFNGTQRVRTSPDRGLKRLSDETGGGFFLLKKKDELGPTFTRIALELHSQYIMGFSPETLDGKVHKLEVKITRPGLTARARKSYVATSGSTTQSGK